MSAVSKYDDYEERIDRLLRLYEPMGSHNEESSVEQRIDELICNGHLRTGQLAKFVRELEQLNQSVYVDALTKTKRFFHLTAAPTEKEQQSFELKDIIHHKIENLRNSCLYEIIPPQPQATSEPSLIQPVTQPIIKFFQAQRAPVQRTPLEMEFQNDLLNSRKDRLDAFMLAGINPNLLSRIFSEAVKRNDLELVKMCLDLGFMMDPNTLHTTLHSYILPHANFALMQLLIDADCLKEISAVDLISLCSPKLIEAICRRGNTEIVPETDLNEKVRYPVNDILVAFQHGQSVEDMYRVLETLIKIGKLDRNLLMKNLEKVVYGDLDDREKFGDISGDISTVRNSGVRVRQKAYRAVLQLYIKMGEVTAPCHQLLSLHSSLGPYLYDMLEYCNIRQYHTDGRLMRNSAKTEQEYLDYALAYALERKLTAEAKILLEAGAEVPTTHYRFLNDEEILYACILTGSDAVQKFSDDPPLGEVLTDEILRMLGQALVNPEIMEARRERRKLEKREAKVR